MNDKFNQSIRPILDCFDKIRIHLKETGIIMPCICSVGCQSAGKSSVLESITGIQLPRGEGTVTRCPIMIQLRNARRGESARIKYEKDPAESWKEIKIEEIAENITKYQEKLLEEEGNPVLSDKAIQLEVQRNSAPDLTLYDLPGITHKDDETFEKIKNIIIKYLESKETIALFVHSSTSDFDANECLSLIRKISNDGENDIFTRTIPIFTKPDDALKTNPGTLVNNLKLGKNLGFEYAPILVLNRSQEQINNNVENEKIRKLEEEMLKNPVIKDYCYTGHGINSLIELLVNIQKEKLLNFVPKLKKAIKDKLREYNTILDNLPKGCRNRKEFNKYLLIYCDKFDSLFQNKLTNVSRLLKADIKIKPKKRINFYNNDDKNNNEIDESFISIDSTNYSKSILEKKKKNKKKIE
jgi:interferon-induced GTP-binding protein Mx1